MRLYRHRVNSLAELSQTPDVYGVEFDLRSDGDRIIVAHDPFSTGPAIDEYLPLVGQRPCIFNVKTEGIEPRVLELAAEHRIQDFFFLDLTVPAAVKLWRAGERRLAARYSEYEPVEGALAWAGKARWLWVDCFARYPGSEADWMKLAAAFDICLVSPELQGHGVAAIEPMRRSLGVRRFDAVCTKRPDLWAGAP